MCLACGRRVCSCVLIRRNQLRVNDQTCPDTDNREVGFGLAHKRTERVREETSEI